MNAAWKTLLSPVDDRVHGDGAMLMESQGDYDSPLYPRRGEGWTRPFLIE